MTMDIFKVILVVLQLQGVFTSPYVSKQPYLGLLNEIYSDESELAEVKYFTNDGGDYHIVQLAIPSLGTFSVHLVQVDTVSPELRITADGNTEVHTDLQNCFYFGHIVGSPGGTAALSNCGDHQGFSGHLLVGDDHLVIEPDTATASEYSSQPNAKGTTILHRVFRSVKILERENVTFSDELRVPEAELKKAIAEANAAEARRAKEAEESDDQMEEDVAPVGTLDSDTDDPTGFTLHTLATNPKKQKQKAKQSGNKKKKPKHKVVVAAHVIEIAVFTDPTLFQYWEKRYAANTKAKLKMFALNLVNNMNLLYRQPSMGVDIFYRLVYMEMLTEVPAEMAGSAPDGLNYLQGFCKYEGDKNKGGADWDHALLLTGYDIIRDGNPNVIGLAFTGTMCLQYWSCSVSEGLNFGTSIIITHEIGHSLGILHDGAAPNAACDVNKFIMSTSTGPGKMTWSPCSSQNVKDFMVAGTPESTKQTLGVSGSAIPTCLKRASSLKGKAIHFSKDKLPGEIFPLKEQCALFCDSCTPYLDDPEAADVCSMLWCSNGASAGMAHPALEGSSCQSGKYCRNGQCVAIPAKTG